jgi:hypothetical protein
MKMKDAIKDKYIEKLNEGLTILAETLDIIQTIPEVKKVIISDKVDKILKSKVKKLETLADEINILKSLLK